MIQLIIAVALLAFAIDIYFGLSRRTRGMQFRFSRYNMYTLQPGTFSVTLSKHYYNLPDNQDVACRFEIAPYGYLDAIRPCENILVGGSAAFGVGSPGNAWNVSGHLREKYLADVINLAIPGWNIEQEVITLLRYLDAIRPKRILLFDGANNLALALPFDYHGYPTSADALAFYGERKYAQAIDEHFDTAPDVRRRATMLVREMLRHSVIARAVYRVAGGQQAAKASAAATGGVDVDAQAAVAVENYLAWLKVLVAVAAARGIEIHCILQPYYSYGRDGAEARNFHFYSINDTFDRYMVAAYGRLDSALSEFAGITYHPVFKEMAAESVGLFTDAVHLNGTGYGVIADKISGIVLGSRHDKETR
jgi:hypothetical protein